MPKPSSTIYLIRHGETDDVQQQLIQGHRDTELNQLGILQAKVTGQHFKEKGIKFDQIFSSDLKRAVQTAEVLANELDNPTKVQIDARLKERFLGLLEGHKRGYDVPNHGAEPVEAVHDRFAEFWREQIIQEPKSEENRTILIVSHGTALRLLLENVLPARFSCYDTSGTSARKLPTCSISVVNIPGSGKPKISSIGDGKHVAGLKVGNKENANNLNDRVHF